jgi:hypothetical protein
MKKLIILIFCLLPFAVVAQPTCTVPATIACRNAASNWLSTDQLLGQQATGPNHVNEYVRVTAAQIAAATSLRQPLAGVQYYANTATGNDTNDCISAGTACKTIRAALSKLITSRDLAGNSVNMNIAAGTYDESVLIAGFNTGGSSVTQTNGGAIILKGAGSGTTTIAPSVNCTPGYGDAITASGGSTVLIQGVTLSTGCSGRADLFVQNFSFAGVSNSDVVFGNAGVANNGQHIHVESNGIFEVAGNFGYTIAGSAAQHWAAGANSHIEMDVGASIICTGSPAFAPFVFVEKSAVVDTGGTAFTGCGSVTGSRYQIKTNGVLNLHGATSLPPGSTAGVLMTGGVIVNDSGSLTAQAPAPSNVTTNLFTGVQDGSTTTTGTITKAVGITWLDLDIFGIGGAGGDGIACGAGASCSGGGGGGGGGHTRVHVRWADFAGSPTTCAVSIPAAHVHGTAGAGTSTTVTCGSPSVQYRAGGGGDGANGASAAIAGGGGGAGISSGAAGTTAGGSTGAGGSSGGNGTGSVPAAIWAGSGGGGSTAAGVGQAGGASTSGSSGGGSGAGFNAGTAGSTGNGGSNQASNATAAGTAGVSDNSGGAGGGGGAAGTGSVNGTAGGAAGNPGGGGGGGGSTNTGSVGQGAAGGYGIVIAVQY